MTSRFKCLIQLNDYKYSLSIDSNNNFITFNNVLNEIQNQIKQNISYETHLFEIFDIDFKEYVLITSGKQIIDNFSRIKVSEKTNNNNEKIGVSSIGSTEDSIKSNTSSNSTHNNNSLDITPIQIKTKPLNNDKYIYNKFSQFQNNINNETIRDLTKIKDNNNEKVVIKGKVEFDSSLEPSKTKFVSKSTASKESTSHSKAMTNYLGHNIPKCGHSSTSSQLAFTTTVEKIGNISTIALKYSYDDIKAFEKLVQIMVNNKYHFKTNSSNDLLFHKKWSLVSEAMKRNDYIEWTPQKCRDSFMGSINWYKKILENSPNYKIASGIYPLFELIHSLNLKYFLKPENFDRVSKLRESFKIKNSQYLETELKIAGKLITEPKFDVNSNPTNNQTYASVLASTSNNTECHQYNDSYNYKTKYFYPNNWVDPHLYQKTSKLMDSDVKEFDLLGKIADKIAAKFGRNIKNFWQIVSDEMLLKGYQSFNADKCRNKFENYVNDYYSLALIYCPNYKTASAVYPLFELIHAMDLKLTLSYHAFQKIDKLRESFNKKCNTNTNMN